MTQSTRRRPRVVLYNPRAVFYTMPLALVALASSLDRTRVEVVIIDGRLEPDPIRAVVDATRDALCLGVTVLTGAPIRDALAVSRAVKAAHPRCTVIWGGWHPSLFDRQCLDEPSVDIVVRGQGEETFRDVVDRLMTGASSSDCPGTTIREGAEAVVAAPRPLRDLNAFPPHDYSLIPVERYFALKGARQIDYISSQGCRFRCAFCADPAVYARGWTGLEPERIAEEAGELQRRYGMEELAFQDETFFTYPPRVDTLADELVRRNLRVTWTATLRADQACRMSEALFAKAVASGLRRVMVGVESGSQETLDWLDKDMTLDQVHRTAALCARHRVSAIFNFIVGFPGEPDTSMRATLALAKTLRRMHPAFETPIFYYRPYPGSPIADRLAGKAPSLPQGERVGVRGPGYTCPQTLEAWADFDYVRGRGPWVSDEQWRTVERFKFYTRHAWRSGPGGGAWRWPLRKAAEWRCERDWYGAPVEKFLVELVRPPQQTS